jgi:hypothetical protein
MPPLDALGLVPSAVQKAFPLDNPSGMLALYFEVEADRRAVMEGKNREFDRIAAELVTEVPAASRERLVDLTTVPVALHTWTLERARSLVKTRAAVNPLMSRYRAILTRLNATPGFTPAAATEIDLVLRYLQWIPTLREIQKWRRQQGVSRGERGLLKLNVWTKRAALLVEYLDGLAIRQRSVAEPPVRGFAEEYAAKLLHARYPKIVPAGAALQLRRRINRS